MKTCKPNDSAMPIFSESVISEEGLTKREYIAAIAMQGLLTKRFYGDYKGLSDTAVRAADYLIAELNKKEGVK